MTEKPTQAKLLQDAYNNVEELQDRQKKGFYTDVIEDVTMSMSHEFFGVTTYEDREGFVIHTETGLSFFMSIPQRLPDSILGKFLCKYGSVPKVGMTIEIDTTESFDKIRM